MKEILLLALGSALASAATFGTAVPVTGGATDLALDEPRNRLYVVNSTQNRVDVYAIAQRRFLSSIPVGAQPLSAAMSRDGRFLYVTSYDTSSLNVVDLNTATMAKRVSLPAAPEGVAVGGDERVLITTVGSGAGNAENRLLLYDPQSADGGNNPRAIATTLPAPSSPQTPTPSRVFMSTRSNLVASQDGQWIIGLNNPNNTTRQLFVYEVGSASILRSRSVSSISNVLAVSRDGSRFMAGLSLFETSTLAIVAQQNAANSLTPFQNNANFNTQQNQGGSVFAPDGSVLYSAFNIAPVQNPAARANTTQLMLSDADNLLIKLVLQLPENLTGNMVANSDGSVIYALSQSGFLILPVSAIYDNPIAVVDNPVLMVTNDQCGVTVENRKRQALVRNGGKGRMTASAQVIQTGPTLTFPIAGQAGGVAIPGAGGGAPGGGFPILLPPGVGGVGGGQILIPPGVVPGQGAAATAAQQTGVAQNAPSVVTRRTDTETAFEFTFNANAARSLGTIAPTDFLVQSPEAINVPARIRVYQNNRNSEARGVVIPVPVSISTAEGLVDIVSDSQRERLYVANSGMNSVEVFDTRTNQFVKSIQVGQLPRSLAMTPNGRLLYVANSGGESISIIDLERGEVTGKVSFPPVPYNAGFALVTPSVIAATLNGLQIVMSDGSLWRTVDDEAVPRRTSPILGTSTVQAPRTMVATPGGEYALLLGGNGTAYLYDAMSDDFVLAQSVVAAPIQGYFGPVAAGPRGQYFVVNGMLLNGSLTPLGGGTSSTRPVAAVAAVSANAIARYTIPAAAAANAVVRDTAVVELVDAATGLPRGPGSPALEGPLASQVGNQRVNVNGRTMAVNAAGNTVYVLTATGLSVIPVNTPTGPPGGNPNLVQVNQNGVVNNASNLPSLAPGSLVSVLGQNLGGEASATGAPLPKLLGGTCVTVDEQPVPLMTTAPGQITAQLPADLKTGAHSLVVRSIDRNAASPPRSITVAKYAPAVYKSPDTGQAAIFHADASPVSKSKKAKRDESLVMYASGLGVTKGADASTDPVKVFFGDPRYSQAEMIVESSVLSPGLIGVYEIEVRVPGNHLKGDELPVTLRIGGIDSPAGPTVAVE